MATVTKIASQLLEAIPPPASHYELGELLSLIYLTQQIKTLAAINHMLWPPDVAHSVLGIMERNGFHPSVRPILAMPVKGIRFRSSMAILSGPLISPIVSSLGTSYGSPPIEVCSGKSAEDTFPRNP